MDRKEMEIILKNSYKGKEILKYICQLEEQVSDNKERILSSKEKIFLISSTYSSIHIPSKARAFVSFSIKAINSLAILFFLDIFSCK